MRALLLLVTSLLACDAGERPESAAPPAPAPEPTALTASPPDTVPSAEPEPPVEAAPADDQPTVESWLQRYDFDDRLWYAELPGRLDEISGLAFDSDGRLFAHDDERGRVHELDPSDGAVLGRFDLGSGRVRDDFEGIAIAGERHFLVSSLGLLYEYRAGDHDSRVDFRMTDSGLGDGCEVEGLDVLDGRELLLACKTVTPESGQIVLLRMPLAGGGVTGSIRVDRTALHDVAVDDDFAPSGVAVSPNGTIVLASGRHEALVEVDREGRLLHAVELRSGRHPQSEGLAFGPDGTLYIADEKNGQDARLSAYRQTTSRGTP